jgi:hypothetical protein
VLTGPSKTFLSSAYVAVLTMADIAGQRQPDRNRKLTHYGFAGVIVSLPSTMGLRSFAMQSP